MEPTVAAPHAYIPSQPAVKSSQPQVFNRFALQSYEIFAIIIAYQQKNA